MLALRGIFGPWPQDSMNFHRQRSNNKWPEPFFTQDYPYFSASPLGKRNRVAVVRHRTSKRYEREGEKLERIKHIQAAAATIYSAGPDTVSIPLHQV